MAKRWIAMASMLAGAAIQCVVDAPAARLLDGFLDPQPDPARMRRALGAASAPGVGSIVVVVPIGRAYDTEIDVLRRHGKPFVIVESPLLFEEVMRPLVRWIRGDEPQAFALADRLSAVDSRPPACVGNLMPA
jgi:hypothetical protein